MLSERTKTWCPLRSGRKVRRPKHTASISRQLMWNRPSSFDQWMKACLPLHSTPLPVLEASVETTSLLYTIPKGTPRSIHWGSFQGARAATQAWPTLTWRCPRRQVWYGTRGFSQYWRGRIRSRPNWSTGDAEAMRPSIFWNASGTSSICSNREIAGWRQGTRKTAAADSEGGWGAAKTAEQEGVFIHCEDCSRRRLWVS